MSNSTPGKAHSFYFICEECETKNEFNITNEDLKTDTVELICTNCGHNNEVTSQYIIKLIEQETIKKLKKQFKLH